MFPLFCNLLSCLVFDVRQFQSVSFFLVNGFQHESQYQGGHAQTGKHYQGSCVVVRDGRFFRTDGSVLQLGYQLRVGFVQHFANQQREEPQADVLYPENKGVGTTDNFGIYQFRYTGPQRGGHQGETGSQNKNGKVSDDDASHCVAFEGRQYECKCEVAKDKQYGADDKHGRRFSFVVDIVT